MAEEHNLRSIYHVKNFPCDTQVRDRLDEVATNLLRYRGEVRRVEAQPDEGMLDDRQQVNGVERIDGGAGEAERGQQGSGAGPARGPASFVETGAYDVVRTGMTTCV